MLQLDLGCLQHTSIMSLSPSLFLLLIPRITHNSNRSTRYISINNCDFNFLSLHPSIPPSIHPTHHVSSP